MTKAKQDNSFLDLIIYAILKNTYMKKTKKTLKEIKRLPLVFQIDLRSFDESGELPKQIQVLPTGKWNHPCYGPIVITREDITEFKRNFDSGLRKDIPITEGHDGFQESPAVGWFVELIDRGGNGLYATVEWTAKGKTLLSEKSYKYFSPEFYSEYEDPQTRDIHENVLVGGALTNKPYFKELEAVTLSEQIIKSNKLNFNNMLTIEELLAKKVEDLSTEEKTHLNENKDKLTDDQIKDLGDVITKEEKTETEDEKKEREEKEEGDANEAKGLNRDGSAKDDKPELTDDEKAENVKNGKNEDGSEKTEEKTEEKVDASEFKTNDKGEVIMSKAQAKILSEKANAGFEASEKLKTQDIEASAGKLIFSEQNSKGKFLPKSSDKVIAFMSELTEAQRKTFGELVESIPANKSIFKEQGSGHAVEGSAFSEIETLATALRKEDKALTYADSISRVCSENKELAERYQKEL